MSDQPQHEDRVVVSWLDLQVPETAPQSVSQLETARQLLEDDQAGKGGQLLVFESESRDGPGFTLDVFSAKLHLGSLFGLFTGSCAQPIITQGGRLFNNNLFNFMSFSARAASWLTSPQVSLAITTALSVIY
jgi:hypothetical protein